MINPTILEDEKGDKYKILCTTHAHILLYKIGTGVITICDAGEIRKDYIVTIPKSQ